MSWPHILSFSRVVAAPIVAGLILSHPGNAYLVAGVLFALASFTDLIDGKLARHSQQVSPLGIFLDTSADKVLVGLALIALSIANLAAAWITLVIISREFLISALRSFAASQDRIISAHTWGKGKAALTMVAVTAVLVAADGKDGGFLARILSHAVWKDLFTASSWLLGAAAVLTIVSGIRYVVDARSLFKAKAIVSDERTEETPRLLVGNE